MMAVPGRAAATAAPMVEKHPNLPPGLTQEASAGVATAVIKAVPRKSLRETTLRRLRGRFEDRLNFIENSSSDLGRLSIDGRTWRRPEQHPFVTHCRVTRSIWVFFVLSPWVPRELYTRFV